MRTALIKQTCLLLSCATLAALYGGSATARSTDWQTSEFVASGASTEVSLAIEPQQGIEMQQGTERRENSLANLAIEPQQAIETQHEVTNPVRLVEGPSTAEVAITLPIDPEKSEVKLDDASTGSSLPESATRVVALSDESPMPPAPQVTPAAGNEPAIVAQDIVPGIATRSGPTYIGIGGNIGLGDGDTALGEGSFAIISKIGLTRLISVRPSALFADDFTLLIPVTYDFSLGGLDDVGFSVAPYLGAGAAISLGDDSAVDLLLTAGVDVPLSDQFTVTGAINASVFDNTAIGFLIGIGYNFPGF